jgi:hypothetical protein
MHQSIGTPCTFVSVLTMMWLARMLRSINSERMLCQHLHRCFIGASAAADPTFFPLEENSDYDMRFGSYPDITLSNQ